MVGVKTGIRVGRKVGVMSQCSTLCNVCSTTSIVNCSQNSPSYSVYFTHNLFYSVYSTLGGANVAVHKDIHNGKITDYFPMPDEVSRERLRVKWVDSCECDGWMCCVGVSGFCLLSVSNSLSFLLVFLIVYIYICV